MDTTGSKRSAIAVIIALIVLVIIYFLVPSVPATPKGVLLPTGKPMSSISANAVNLFAPDSPPLAYEKIGYVSVMLHSVESAEAGQLAVEQYTRELAASVGANGVIVTLFGHTVPGSVPSSQASYALRGVAIHYLPNT